MASQESYGSPLAGTLVITGAAGVIGTALRRAVEAGPFRGLQIVCVSRRQASVHGAAAGTRWVQWDVLHPPPRELLDLGRAPGPVWVVHCASTVQSRQMVADPLSVLDTCVVGTRNVLDLCARIDAERMVNVSSVEVFGRCLESRVGEDDLGRVDLAEPRSCYPMGKRMSEHLCALYRSQHGLEAVSVRPGPSLGYGLPPTDGRVAAQFIGAALRGEDIVLRSSGTSLLNTIDTLDAAAAVLRVLTLDRCAPVYNVVNPEGALTVRAFAELVVDEVGGRGGAVRVELMGRSATGYAADVSHAVSAELLTSTGWRPTVSLRESIRRVRDYWGGEAETSGWPPQQGPTQADGFWEASTTTDGQEHGD